MIAPKGPSSMQPRGPAGPPSAARRCRRRAGGDKPQARRAQRAEETLFHEIRRLGEDVGGLPPTRRQPSDTELQAFQLWRTDRDGGSRTRRRYDLRHKVLTLSRSSPPARRQAVRPLNPVNDFTQTKTLKSRARIERA
jgi:hypothetical protein